MEGGIPMGSIDVPEPQNPQRLTIDIGGQRLSKCISPVVEYLWNENCEELEKEIRRNPHIVNNEQTFGDALIHLATENKKLRSLQTILKNGAETSLPNKAGDTALHLAVSARWQEGIAELLNHGASPDILSEPKANTTEAYPQTALHIALRGGDNKSTALLLRKSQNLTLCDGKDRTVLHMAAEAHSYKILTRLLHDPSCQEIIAKNDCKGNSVLHAAIHNENIEEGHGDEVEHNIIKVVKLLLDNGIKIDSTNSEGVTAVHLAAKDCLPKVAKQLIDSGAELSLLTNSKDSVLHAACESGSNECLEIFIKTGKVDHLIKEQNKEKKDPFNLAIDSSATQCCEILLNNGDHLGNTDFTGKTRCSLILEKIPNSCDLLTRVFDKHVRVSDKLVRGDPNYSIEFDYSPILRQETGDSQCSLIPKLSAPKFRKLLKHPLIESFLLLKWNRLRFMFYSYVFLYFTFLIVHSTYIFYTFGPMDKNWRGDSKRLMCVQILHIILYICFLVPGSGMVLMNKNFFKERETYYILFTVLASAFVVFSPNTCDCWGGSRSVLVERPVAALSAVFAWGEFSLLLGKFPKLGKYIAMLSVVAESMVKVLLGFASLLIGFGISFSILYNDQNVFSSLTHSMVKILMMMIGEYNYVVMPDSEDLAGDSKLYIVYFGSILLIFFLLIVSVLMTNLFIGVAVYDIGELLISGKIERLYKQAQYINAYDNLLKFVYDHKWERSLTVLARAGKVNIKPQVYLNKTNHDDTFDVNLPKDVIEESISINATKNGKENIFQYNEETDIAKFMKSFRAFYMTDLHKQNKQREEETKQHTFLLDRLENLENMLESHSSKSI